MSRFYFSTSGGIAWLPRIRLTTGSSIGLGFQLLHLWLHVWIRPGSGPDTRMFELLPHVWTYSGSHGLYLHFWWLRFKWTKQLIRRTPKGEIDAFR